VADFGRFEFGPSTIIVLIEEVENIEWIYEI